MRGEIKEIGIPHKTKEENKLKGRCFMEKLLAMGALWILILGIILYAPGMGVEKVIEKEQKEKEVHEVLKVGDEDGMKVVYLNKKALMYWEPNETKGRIYEIEAQDAVLKDTNETGKIPGWESVFYKNIEGWVKSEDLTESTVEKDIEKRITVKHEKEGKNGFESKSKHVTVYNTKRQVERVMKEHIGKLESYGADMDTFLAENPLKVLIRDYEGSGSGGEYHYREEMGEASKIILSAYEEHGTVTDYILIHEFGHHVGYKVGHPGKDFKEFSKYKDLDREVENDDWANKDIEKYADTHAEAYLAGYNNSTSTGNFKTEKERLDFVKWEIGKINQKDK